MKFDYQSIKDRLITNIRKRNSWIGILPNSVNMRLIEGVAEELSELSRYDEYLLRESKWNLAQNRTSLFHQATLLGYQPHRKIGATGLVQVSSKKDAFSPLWVRYLSYSENDVVRHNNRIWQCTVSTTTSEPEEGNEDWVRIRTTHTRNIGIPKYTEMQGTNGLKYTVVEATTLEASSDYTTVKVVQGEARIDRFTATGEVFEELEILNENIDNNNYEIFVNGSFWGEIDNLRKAGPDDFRYQVFNSPNFDKVIFRFGDGRTGQKLDFGDQVTIHWIETEGARGNVTAQNSIVMVTSPMTDIRGNNVMVYCNNYDGIVGGKDTEGISSIRKNGVFTFQAGERLVTVNDYRSFVETNFDFIGKAVVWGAYEINIDNNNDPWEWIPTTENMIYISAITPGSEPLDFMYNVDGSENEGNKIAIIREMQEKKSPTDIIAFEPVEFIHLITNTHAFVKSENYLLPEVIENIKNTFIQNYGIESMTFKQSIYESNYYRLVDDIDGVRYHNTIFSFYKITNFLSEGKNIANVLQLNDIKPGSVSIVAINRSNGSQYKIAEDNGEGVFTPVSGYTISNANIDYTTGAFTIVVDSGLELTWEEYEVRTYYDTVVGDILPIKRNQIIYLDTNEININAEYYRGN